MECNTFAGLSNGVALAGWNPLTRQLLQEALQPITPGQVMGEQGRPSTCSARPRPFLREPYLSSSAVYVRAEDRIDTTITPEAMGLLQRNHPAISVRPMEHMTNRIAGGYLTMFEIQLLGRADVLYATRFLIPLIFIHRSLFSNLDDATRWITTSLFGSERTVVHIPAQNFFTGAPQMDAHGAAEAHRLFFTIF